MEWLALHDGYLSVVVPVSFITAIIVVVVIVCVVCRRRPCTSKPSSPPPPPHQPQSGCSAPTTSSVTTTAYLPGAAPTTSSGLDEYTRCFVAPRRLDGSVVEWTGAPAAGGTPSATAHGVVGVGPVASSSPRQPLMSAGPPTRHSDVRYRFYDEC